MQIIVDEKITSYYVYGKENQNCILLIHGWGDNALGMQGLANALAANNKVVVPDLPGFGGTEVPKEAWGLDDYATYVNHFLDKIGLNPEVMIGHSNGGAIAIRGVANGNLEPKKLVLLSSAGIRSQYNGRKKMLRLLAKFGKVCISWLPKSIRLKIRKKAYNSIGSDLFVAENLQETFKKIVSDDVQNDAKIIAIPTLLIYGKEDTATPAEYGKIFLGLISGSKLEVIEGAGHFVHLDAPQEVNKYIQEFIK